MQHQTLSIQVDPAIKRRLTELSRKSKRSNSFLAAEAIAAFVEKEEWQMREVVETTNEMEDGRSVSRLAQILGNETGKDSAAITSHAHLKAINPPPEAGVNFRSLPNGSATRKSRLPYGL